MANQDILIVDDDRDLVSVLAEVLNQAGYRVTTSLDGDEAWQKVQKFRPDLAIIDCMMSRLTEGIDLTFRFRQDKRLQDVPIIMLTAINEKLPFKIDRETDEVYLPVDKFIEKPVDPDVLLREIRSLLQARGVK